MVFMASSLNKINSGFRSSSFPCGLNQILLRLRNILHLRIHLLNKTAFLCQYFVLKCWISFHFCFSEIYHSSSKKIKILQRFQVRGPTFLLVIMRRHSAAGSWSFSSLNSKHSNWSNLPSSCENITFYFSFASVLWLENTFTSPVQFSVWMLNWNHISIRFVYLHA